LLALTALIAALIVLVTVQPAAAERERAPCSDPVGNIVEQVRDRTMQRMPGYDKIPNNPYEPESLDGVWNRCIKPFLESPEPEVPEGPLEDPLNGGAGSTSGEPHLITLDGLRYDFHGAGDFVLLATDEYQAQARYTRSKYATFTHAVALQVGDTIVELGLLTPEYSVTVNGRNLEVDGTGWQDLDGGYVMWTGDVLYVQLETGLALEGSRAGVSVFVPEAQLGEVRGLLGDGDGDPGNDLTDGQGGVIDGSLADELYGPFFDAWYVQPADSIFATTFDEELDGPLRPVELVTLADLDAADVSAAAEVCAAAGLIAGEGLDECIYDVAVTGDPGWADGTPQAARRLGVPVETLSTTIEDSVALEALDSVRPDQPAAGAGRIGAPGAVDDYQLPAAQTDRVLEVGPLCDDFGAPTATVSDGDQVVGIVPLTCGRALAIPASPLQIRVSTAVGAPVDYSFDIRLGPSSDGVTNQGQVIGDVIVLDVTQPNVPASATLTLGAGERIYIETIEHIASGRLRILDPEGVALVSALSFEDLGVFEAETAGGYQIVVEPAQSTGRQLLVVYQVARDIVNDAVFDADLELRITTPGQQASLDVDLAAGDRVYVQTLERFVRLDGEESNRGTLIAVGPDGSLLAEAFAFRDLGLITATVSGRHRVTLVPGGPMVGSQVVRVVRTAPNVEQGVDVGDEFQLTITTPGQSATALVDLDSGQVVLLETIEGLAGRLTVTGPSGVEIVDRLAVLDIGTFTADATGTYRITLTGNGATTGTQVVQLSPG
jgi:hypothetical protein